MEESKTLQSYQKGLGAKRVKPEKYEALNKALKKLLQILRSEIVLVNRSLLKKKALEFAKELSIEGFQVSEVWLKMVNEKYGQWKPFKNNEKCFLFYLKSLFVLKIFNFLSWLFDHVEEWLDYEDKVSYKIYDVTT